MSDPLEATETIPNDSLRQSVRTGEIGKNLGMTYSVALPIEGPKLVAKYVFRFAIRNAQIHRQSQTVAGKPF